MPGHPIRLVLLPAAAFLSVAIAKDSNNNNRRQTDFIGVTRELGGWSTDVKKNAEQSKNSLNMVQVHPPPKGKVHASLQFRITLLLRCYNFEFEIRSKAIDACTMPLVSFISSTVHAAY